MLTTSPTRPPRTITNNHLAHELDRLGVPFVRAESESAPATSIPPATLLAGLAASDKVRLRLALIPLLLVHRAYAAHASEAAAQLSPAARLLFSCYYTAALLLQQLHAGRIRQLLGEPSPLPDLFSSESGISPACPPNARPPWLPVTPPSAATRSTWLGAYQHGAERLLVHLEKHRQWAN